jgi:hypothetical protein
MAVIGLHVCLLGDLYYAIIAQQELARMIIEIWKGFISMLPRILSIASNQQLWGMLLTYQS